MIKDKKKVLVVALKIKLDFMRKYQILLDITEFIKKEIKTVLGVFSGYFETYNGEKT